MMSEKEYEAREKVIVSVSEWIVERVNGDTHWTGEDYLADVIRAFAELFKTE